MLMLFARCLHLVAVYVYTYNILYLDAYHCASHFKIQYTTPTKELGKHRMNLLKVGIYIILE